MSSQLLSTLLSEKGPLTAPAVGTPNRLAWPRGVWLVLHPPSPQCWDDRQVGGLGDVGVVSALFTKPAPQASGVLLLC